MNNSKIVERFFTDDKVKNLGGKNPLHIRDGVLYSYGSHFPLVYRLSDGNGGWWFLMNGDKYSISTSRHQRECFEYKPTIIPFSALTNALGIRRYSEDFSFFRLIEKREDVYIPYPCPKKGIGCQEGCEILPSDCDGDGRMEQIFDGIVSEHSRHILGASVISYDGSYFLSSTDDRDGSYFLCELPRAVKSVDEAFEVLKPDAIRGKEWKRQGDWFFVEANGDAPSLAEMRKLRTIKMTPLYANDSHVPTETKATPDSRLLVRGNVWHRPHGRSPEHKRLALGKAWHFAYKNTALGGWGATGKVD